MEAQGAAHKLHRRPRTAHAHGEGVAASGRVRGSPSPAHGATQDAETGARAINGAGREKALPFPGSLSPYTVRSRAPQGRCSRQWREERRVRPRGASVPPVA